VPQPGEVTHVSGHLPFVVDITSDILPGVDNVISVRVSNNKSNPFYTDPILGTNLWFGMGMGGMIRPVLMHIADPVHVPLNVFPNLRRWGTYVATTEATPARGIVRIQTNVYNDGTENKQVTLIIQIVDKQNNVVATKSSTHTVDGDSNYVFDQIDTIANPALWYPNASIHGKPYLYKVYHIVQVGSSTVDVTESPLGIRVVTWDSRKAYFNGQPHFLQGFGSRYEIPAIGMALSEEMHWRDIKYIAECGGRMLRPGHVPASPAVVAACDAFGVCLFENTMDDEWKIGMDATWQYKKEFHRDCIIRDRNNPSVVVWEFDNGPYKVNDVPVTGFNGQLIALTKQWDYLTPRTGSTRGGELTAGSTPAELIHSYGIDQKRISTRPDWNAECWFPSRVARYHWEWQVKHTDDMINEYNKAITGNECAWTHWMLMETTGESYMGYLGEPGNGFSTANHKSLGASAMDQNRLPKLIYTVWKNGLWIPYSIKPGVALQSHWNYSAGTRTVTAYSNCPRVELFVNSVSKGFKTPDVKTSKCEWTNIAWERGTLRADGQDAGGKAVCSDERKTAATPHHIVLTMEAPAVRPDGSAFVIRANGVDAGFVLATIVDSAGNWCPLAENNITFATSGAGTYLGSANFMVDLKQSLATYHAPGSPELMAEGGQMKVAVRATFAPGTVSITASAPGLAPGTTTFQTHPLVDGTAIGPRAGTVRYAGELPQSRTFKVIGNSLTVPKEFTGKSVSAAIYDLSGRHLQDLVSRAGKVSHGKKLQKNGVYIIRYRVLSKAGI
jgi:beta-galactosidase